MSKGKSITQMSAVSLNLTTGAESTHQLSFTTVTPMKATDQLVILVPDQVKAPIQNDGCVGSGALQPTLSCTVIQSTIIVNALQFVQSGSELAVGESTTVSIAGVSNRLNSKESDSYKIYIKAADGTIKSQMDRDGVATVTMTQPALIQTGSFEATDNRQLAKTAFTMEFTSTLPYPKDAYFTIQIDPQVLGPESGKTVACFSNLQI